MTKEKEAKFSDLLGQTLISVEKVEKEYDNRIIFINDAGIKYVQYHREDCCENVYIESIVGDLSDLVGSPILVAEEVEHKCGITPEEVVDKVNKDYEDESFTWTFYKLATIKGHVDIRWYGSSNGYYSESVSFTELEE